MYIYNRTNLRELLKEQSDKMQCKSINKGQT